ncbi:MAG: hypothetical protein ACQEW8_13470 [Actinomycetota bacterium]
MPNDPQAWAGRCHAVEDTGGNGVTQAASSVDGQHRPVQFGGDIMRQDILCGYSLVDQLDRARPQHDASESGRDPQPD